MKAARLLAVLLLAASTSFAESKVVKGVFSLQGDSPKTNGYLRATTIGGNPLDQRLDFWMTPPTSTQPIRSYQVEMTKKLHVVIVSDDFKTFIHIHPTLTPSGHLEINQKFPAPGLYQVYADGLPNDLNHQVFRFALPIGSAAASSRIIKPTGLGVRVGPYEVDLSSVHLRAGDMDMIDVEILKDGQPAKDLHPYLGVPAHAVFLNTKDLSYVHTHPMAMGASMDMSANPPELPDSAPSPPEMMLHVSIKEAGTYRLWLQFHGGAQLYVAQFTLTAS